MTRNTNSGYHDCPCRDCFDVAIGCDDDNVPDLCIECESAGCDATGAAECARDAEPEPEEEPWHVVEVST